MDKKELPFKHRKSWYITIGIVLVPILAMVLMTVLFVYGGLQGVKATYHISSEDIDSPYNIFDKVLLLNSYTKEDFVELKEQVATAPEKFQEETFLRKENELLKEKYSFLAVVLDGTFSYFGNEEKYDSVSRELLQENRSDFEENANYYESGNQKFLIKKCHLALADGTSGSVYIVTDLNVSLPHISIFTVGLIVTIIVICLLVIIAIIGYTYYNIVTPIRELEKAVVKVSQGDMDYPLDGNLDNEFGDLYKEFDHMRLILKTSIEERDKSDALTKEVIGNISHDLKTPLTAIKGYSEGIMDGVAATPEQLDKYVSTIHTKAVDMAVLVDELSYFTKIYQRKENFNFQEVIVNRYFSECVAAMALDLETRDIQLLYRSDVSEDTIVTLDEEKIKRVINNIIGNAVKYIYHHHGMLLVQLSEDEEQVTVMIRDNGKGIEEEELPYIFDRFYRTDSSRNSKTGGSGLGLAIAKKIIDEHNGKIWAESEVDKGTAMYFSLPK